MENFSARAEKTLYDVRGVLRKGDLILTTFPGISVVSGLIRFFEKIYSKDKHAVYTHANFISMVDLENGVYEVLDTRWKVERVGLFEAYRGSRLSVLRIRHAPDEAVDLAVERMVASDEGETYPVWRLFAHAFRLADNIHWDKMVCSERAIKMWHWIARTMGMFDFENYYGWTPDDIHDFVKDNNDRFEIVFDGVC